MTREEMEDMFNTMDALLKQEGLMSKEEKDYLRVKMKTLELALQRHDVKVNDMKFNERLENIKLALDPATIMAKDANPIWHEIRKNRIEERVKNPNDIHVGAIVKVEGESVNEVPIIGETISEAKNGHVWIQLNSNFHKEIERYNKEMEEMPFNHALERAKQREKKLIASRPWDHLGINLKNSEKSRCSNVKMKCGVNMPKFIQYLQDAKALGINVKGLVDKINVFMENYVDPKKNRSIRATLLDSKIDMLELAGFTINEVCFLFEYQGESYFNITWNEFFTLLEKKDRIHVLICSLHYHNTLRTFFQSIDDFKKYLSSPKTLPPFKINDYLTLKLEGKKTEIYVKGEKFMQCKYLLMNIDPTNPKTMEQQDEIESMDEAARILDRSLEHESNVLSPEEEFWGHCSNLQAWVENDYDLRILHSNLSKPLLKKLIHAGDQRAFMSYKEYLIEQMEGVTEDFNSNILEEQITNNEFISLLSPEEREFFFELAWKKGLLKIIFFLYRKDKKMALDSKLIQEKIWRQDALFLKKLESVLHDPHKRGIYSDKEIIKDEVLKVLQVLKWLIESGNEPARLELKRFINNCLDHDWQVELDLLIEHDCFSLFEYEELEHFKELRKNGLLKTKYVIVDTKRKIYGHDLNNVEIIPPNCYVEICSLPEFFSMIKKFKDTQNFRNKVLKPHVRKEMRQQVIFPRRIFLRRLFYEHLKDGIVKDKNVRTGDIVCFYRLSHALKANRSPYLKKYRRSDHVISS